MLKISFYNLGVHGVYWGICDRHSLFHIFIVHLLWTIVIGNYGKLLSFFAEDLNGWGKPRSRTFHINLNYVTTSLKLSCIFLLKDTVVNRPSGRESTTVCKMVDAFKLEFLSMALPHSPTHGNIIHVLDLWSKLTWIEHLATLHCFFIVVKPTSLVQLAFGLPKGLYWLTYER